MKTIDKSQLTAQLLEFLRLVELEGEEILVMDDNKPVVIISQYEKSVSTEELFKDMRGKVKYFEDLTTPTTEEWQEVGQLSLIPALSSGRV
ncbi:type II toxin-antitoxin system Phd/YefM family antitoxin [Microcoleus sp. B4-D4]|uniref:type II toxin-antitoxin system Phd/YefM family antitoxin n=1 Tax=Microcoleus sp. B4-D4 TaxID=2818667 RepID=UPI002FD1E1B8